MKGSHDQVILSKLADPEVKIVWPHGIWLVFYSLKDSLECFLYQKYIEAKHFQIQ